MIDVFLCCTFHRCDFDSQGPLSHPATFVIGLQVQESTLGWLVGVTAATALHLGPALLPLQGQIKHVLTAVFAAPSKVWPLADPLYFASTD